MEVKSRRTSFDRVDRTTDPADFVRYLDATRAADFFREIKQRSYDLLALHAGDHVLDPGCGTGDDADPQAGIAPRPGSQSRCAHALSHRWRISALLSRARAAWAVSL